MIPKVIHYCWFGKSQKPTLVLKCIQSWKQYCPDYEIIEWNEENFDVNCNDYVREAYGLQKWAFVTDYARLWIIYNYGGIYLDTDVEVIRSFNDLLSESAFFGFEDEKSIGTGLGFGAEKENDVIELMLRDYEDLHFVNTDGSYDATPCPIRNTKAIEHLLPSNYNTGNIVRIEKATFYPPEYFCPLDHYGVNLRKTKNTYSIHWFSATWLTDDEKVAHEFRIFRKKCEKMFGEKVGGYIARFIYLFHPKKRKVLQRM